ncbi:MAG: Crp/Fnr family transcriptional regulator [Rhodothalassiaceae bacterium]
MKQSLERPLKLAALLPDLSASSAAVAALEAAASPRPFHPGQQLIVQDDGDSLVYLMVEGRARAVLYSAHGNEVWLDDFQPGDLFGEMAAIGGLPRTSTVVTQTAGLAYGIASEQFVALMRDHGDLAVFVARRLVARVHRTTQRMFELSSLSATGRIYGELRRMAVDDPTDPERSRIDHLPSMTELGKRVNATRETVSRKVNQLRKLGLVRDEGDGLLILSPDWPNPDDAD